MRFHRFLLPLAMGVLAVGTAPPAQAASFDCTKAKAADEVAVCGNAELSELDTEMAALWFAFGRFPVGGMGESQIRREEAQAFLHDRGACGGDVACLSRAYRARIAALKANIQRAAGFVAQAENYGMSRLPVAIVELVVAGTVDECRKLGGRLDTGSDHPVSLWTADLDGDGKPDYVLDKQNLACSGAATAFCSNAGCEIAIALSRNGYRQPIEDAGALREITEQADGTVVELDVDASRCKLEKPGDKTCTLTYSWKDGKVRQSYAARPRDD